MALYRSLPALLLASAILFACSIELTDPSASDTDAETPDAETGATGEPTTGAPASSCVTVWSNGNTTRAARA